MQDIPVIIIGAGPAGSAASVFLSKAGIRHLLLDKQTFPRDKVCGDGCSGKTAQVLLKANPDWLQEIVQDSGNTLLSRGIKFYAPNGKPISIPFNGSNEKITGFTCRRIDFDHFLFQKTRSEYAEVFTGISGLTVERSPGFVVHFKYLNQTLQYRTSLLIAADGDKSQVRKNIHLAEDKAKSYAVGVRNYYKGVQGMDENNFIELHFIKGLLPGYFWIFPMANNMSNVGLVMLSEDIRNNRINLRDKMQEIIDLHPTIKNRFVKAEVAGKNAGWGLPMRMSPSAISGEGYLLAGDAAHLVDPFSGEGIGNALYSGMLAAHAAEKAIEQNNYTAAFFRENYDAVVWRYFGAEFKISATLQKLTKQPWLFNWVVNKAGKSKALQQTLSGMFNDMQVRDQLRKPSFYFKVLFNR
ncbi:NAD(P)/FAD-dependent oxidoreductase [Haoranjiania flava]|uniref:Geranylgeranyl reductase family protein n=1 Tax=Haoranjiania flava TaxID=1856322 RepID=A0AAE3IL96_9BACT|nr:geranylgeranyl reductase family protein [Haoranjiania flava]MCU7693924.1 geranylgeranyl reductase family protein [Haoranjiania flava]